jgi:hypothetical protein
MMKYVFIIAFIAVSIYASIITSGIGFDYENATPEERVAWIETQADITETSFRKALQTKYGYGSPLTIKSTKSSSSMTVEMTITLALAEVRKTAQSMRGDLRELFCPRYAKLPLSDHGLAVMLRLEDMDGKVATRMTISAPECEKQAQLALAAH